MAISYPLTPPATPGFRNIEWMPKTVVGVTASPYTGQSQTYVWPGQWWEVSISMPPMVDSVSALWEAWKLSLNGQQGTFYLGDSIRKTTRGTAAGSITVGASATANSTSLPLSGGSGSFAVGDWLQVSTHLYRVLKVNVGSVDVFPRLRSSYESGTAIVYTNPKGIFRLATNEMGWSYDMARIGALSFEAREAI